MLAIRSAFLLRALPYALIALPVYAQVPLATWTGRIDEREYVATNGRKVRISSMGNVTGFQDSAGQEHINTKRSREGYVLAYRPPGLGRLAVVYDVHDAYSSVLSGTGRDIVPDSF